jgi:hypothetical protein
MLMPGLNWNGIESLHDAFKRIAGGLSKGRDFSGILFFVECWMQIALTQPLLLETRDIGSESQVSSGPSACGLGSLRCKHRSNRENVVVSEAYSE